MEQRKKRLHSVLDPKCCLVHLQKKFQQLLNWNYLLMRKARFTKVSKCRWHVSKGRDLEKRISFHNTRKDNVLKPSNLQKTLKRKGKRICATTMLKMILIFFLPIPQCANITPLPAQISASNFHDLTQITQRRVCFNPKRTEKPCALG